MFTSPLFTLSFSAASGMRYLTKILLIVLALACLGLVGDPDTQPPISYTVNGYTVVRPSELGPLTGTLGTPELARGPGHDYGAIYTISEPGMSQPEPQPQITYIVNGYTVVRPSELGPLTGTIEEPRLALVITP